MIRRVSGLLLSVRTALVLILLLAVATFAGTMLIQAPSAVPLGGVAYAEWVETVRPRFGMWTDALSFLGLFHVFRVWWFQALVAALALSIAYCSIHRWQTISREVFRPLVKIAPKAFDRDGVLAVSVPADHASAAAALRAELAGHGYRVLEHERADALHLYADRNRFARFGTLLAHASLVLLLVAAGLGGRLGWSDEGFVVPEGSTRDVGLAGLAVHVTSFAAEYYPSGEPKDFRSELIVYDGGTEAARKTVRVNEPLEYNGVRFYQSFFGPAAYIRVTDETGAVVLEDGVALAWRVDGDRPAGSIALPARGVTAFVVAPSTGGRGDTLITPGEVRLEIYREGTAQPVAMENLAQGDGVSVAGLRFEFLRERQFTGLRVTRDPTVPIIWLASALMIIGLTAVFAFPYRRLWARIAPADLTGTRLSLLTVGKQAQDATDELAALADRTARAAQRRKE